MVLFQEWDQLISASEREPFTLVLCFILRTLIASDEKNKNKALSQVPIPWFMNIPVSLRSRTVQGKVAEETFGSRCSERLCSLFPATNTLDFCYFHLIEQVQEFSSNLRLWSLYFHFYLRQRKTLIVSKEQIENPASEKLHFSNWYTDSQEKGIILLVLPLLLILLLIIISWELFTSYWSGAEVTMVNKTKFFSSWSLHSFVERQRQVNYNLCYLVSTVGKGKQSES